jgi:hypothetical protein
MYLLFSIVAATVALISQAAAEHESMQLPEGISSTFQNAEVIKASGAYYCWFIGLFVTFSAVRLLILFVCSRDRSKLS